MNKIRIGFTLAEILITLTVIGVVVVMTIPGLMQSKNNQDYVIGLKKFYEVANQAFRSIANDNGCVGNLACTGIFETGTSAIEQAILSHFNISKNCGNQSGCTTDGAKNLNYSSGSDWDYGSVYNIKTVLSDGMIMAVRDLPGNCTYSQTKCGSLVVDVNGFKPPNQIGRDVFQFDIYNNGGINPAYGYQDIAYNIETFGQTGADDFYWKTSNTVNRNCSMTSSSYGLGCAARIMEESWQMNY